MYTLVKTKANDSLPVSLEELKDQVGIPQASPEEDNTLLNLAAAATSSLERGLGNRAFLPSEYRLGLECFPGLGRPIRLPVFRATELLKLTYRDRDDELVDWTDQAELIEGAWPSQVYPKDDMGWPVDARPRRANSVFVEWEAASNADELAEAKIVILQTVAIWFAVKTPETDRKLEEIPSARALMTRLKVGTDYEEYAT